MSPEIRDALATHKPALLALLAGTPEAAPAPGSITVIDRPGCWPDRIFIASPPAEPEPEPAPEPEPRLPHWVAPNLTADEVAAVEAILAWPLDDRTSWAGIIEAGRAHNAAIMARKRKT
jgi:hypothetical protein